eukprot:SAG11_NODE_30354_length_301_cov_4.797030_1_plen_73_part_01
MDEVSLQSLSQYHCTTLDDTRERMTDVGTRRSETRTTTQGKSSRHTCTSIHGTAVLPIRYVPVHGKQYLYSRI